MTDDVRKQGENCLTLLDDLTTGPSSQITKIQKLIVNL